MTPGVGYIAMGPISGTFPQTQSVVFNGEINNGVIQTPISLSGNHANNNDDYNFIGNPYPSAINVDLLLNNSLNTSTVNGTIYLWTHNTEINTNVGEYAYTADDYATYTSGTGGTAAVSSINKSVIPISTIASGQGFFIEAIANGSITFNNTMRISTDNNNFFRNPETKSSPIEKDRIWLNLSNDKGAFNQLLVGFIEGASNEIDRYDGLKLGGSYVSFYSIIDGEKFAVNGRGRLTDQEVISLGFSSKIDEGEILKISIAHIEGRLNSPEFDILLKDNLLNTIHNLNEDDYEFIINEKGTFNNRFELIINTFSVLDIEDEFVNNELIITNTENQMTVSINNSSIISSFKVYDILGKLIIGKTPNKDEVIINTQNISKGTVLIIKVTLENSLVVSKKVILSR